MDVACVEDGSVVDDGAKHDDHSVDVVIRVRVDARSRIGVRKIDVEVVAHGRAYPRATAVARAESARV